MGAPYMPLYVADYLADTTHLSTWEHGAYLLLLMNLWRHGGKLPKDDQTLARMARLTMDRWARVAPVVLPFFTLDGDFVTHKRVTAELSRYGKTVSGRSDAGKRGVAARRLKNNNSSQANGHRLFKQPEPELRDKNLAPTEREILISGERVTLLPDNGQASPVRLYVDEDFVARQLARLEQLEKEDADGHA